MPELSLLLLALAAALLLLALRLRRRRQSAPPTVAPIAVVTPAPAAGHGDDSAASAAAADEAEQPSVQIDVDAVEPLTEAQIYLSFGYARRAADTLRACVESNEAVAGEVLETLCRLYLELGTLDDYCDILARRQLTAAELERAIRIGLQVDRNHLGLRVLADERLHMGPEAFMPAQTAIPDTAGAVAPPPRTPRAPNAAATPPDSPCLVDGGGAVLHTLARDETRVIRLFVPPQRRVRLLMAANDSDNALPALRAALAETPGKPALLIDLLRVHYLHRNIDAYALALWQLYVALGEAGAGLRDKLLHYGLALGYHPAFASLAEADSRMALEAVGQRHGFVRSRPALKPTLWLVEKQADPAASSGASVLQEADSYLTFGQLDEAVNLLEQSVALAPQQLELYPPLLALYEKMEDLPRLRALQSTLQQGPVSLPDEVAAMINTLIQRLQRPVEVA